MSNRKRPRGRPSKYPPEFQRDAVAMVLDEGRAIAEVGRAIGVNEGTLGNWVAKARRERRCWMAMGAVRFGSLGDAHSAMRRGSGGGGVASGVGSAGWVVDGGV